MAARARIVDHFDPDLPDDGMLALVSTAIADPLDHHLLGRFESAGPASLSSLRQATARFLRRTNQRSWFDPGRKGRFEPGRRSRVSIALRDEDASVFRKTMEDTDGWWLVDNYFTGTPRPSVVHLEDGRCWVSFSVRREDKADPREIEGILSPFLARLDASADVTVAPLEGHQLPGFKLEVEIRPEFRGGTTLADAWSIGEDAAALIEVVAGDEIPRSILLDLLRAGRWGVFKGQPESDWLEAKGAPYAEANPRLAKNWKYELGKDVAAFANAPEGGVIVVGMTTEDKGDGEVITGFKEFDLKRVTASSYGNYIAQLIHPRIEGFEVARIRGRGPGRGIAALVIPPQDPSNLPFLVRGVVRDAEVLGNHLLWPVRLGGQTALLDADAVHARLRLGDQVIKGQGGTSRRRPAR